MSNVIHNERIKLTATWLNTLSGGLIAAGVFTPLAALVLGTTPVTASIPGLVLLSSGCVLAGIALHIMARWLIGKLIP